MMASKPRHVGSRHEYRLPLPRVVTFEPYHAEAGSNKYSGHKQVNGLEGACTFRRISNKDADYDYLRWPRLMAL